MVAEVVDAVVVDDRAVGLYFVIGAEAVFHDEKREAVAVVKVVQGQPQALGVDDPAPIGSSEVGVAGAAEDAVFVRGGFVLCGDGAVRVVAEGHEVDCILTEDIAVVGGEGDCEAGSLVFFEQVGRVLAKNLNVDQSVVDPVLGLRL